MVSSEFSFGSGALIGGFGWRAVAIIAFPTIIAIIVGLLSLRLVRVPA